MIKLPKRKGIKQTLLEEREERLGRQADEESGDEEAGEESDK